MSISTLTQLAEVETSSPPGYYRELRALIFFFEGCVGELFPREMS